MPILPANPDLPMVVRRELRLEVIAAMQRRNTANTLGWTIKSPGSWATSSASLPALLIRSPKDHKEAIGRTMPAFTTTVTVELEARLEADTQEAAQDAIEAMCYQIEEALCKDYWLGRRIQQIVSIDTESVIDATSKLPLGGARITAVLECFESFDPGVAEPAPSAWPLTPPADPLQTPLQEIQLHADLVNVFDPAGTYASPPFPDSVTPAPRTQGPDGRDEGALDLTLPQ